MSGIFEYIIDIMYDEKIDVIRTNYILLFTNSINTAKEDIANMTYLMEKGLLEIIISAIDDAL